MNFLRQGFRKLSYDRQADTTEIIYHAALRVVKNTHWNIPPMQFTIYTVYARYWLPETTVCGG